jgi:membrane protein DedA with SNARE-associated domain
VTIDAVFSAATTATTLAAAQTNTACATGGSGVIAEITNWLVHLMSMVGGPAVGFGVALESIFPPIPSEVILPLAGFSAAQGDLSLIEALIWATIGSLVGAWILYADSRAVGFDRLKNIATKIPGVVPEHFERADRWFTKYGTWSVLFGRVIPVVRSLISIPAGINRMNFMHFTGWTLLGSFVWNSILIGFGYGLGHQWCLILGVLDKIEIVIITLFCLVIVYFLAKWIYNLATGKGPSRKAAPGNAVEKGELLEIEPADMHKQIEDSDSNDKH